LFDLLLRTNKQIFMREFIKLVCAAVLGFVIASVIIFVLLLVLIGGIANGLSNTQSVSPAENSVLQINLDYDIPERTDINPLHGITYTNYQPNEELGLNDVLKVINKAAYDPKIKGVFLDFGEFPSGIATAEQIRKALVDFKESGKFVIAYSEVYSQKAYYVESVADKIFLNPQGYLDFRGLGINILFYKNMLDKLGIQMQVIYEGKYKTATEPFRLDSMSKPNKEMSLSMINDIQNNLYISISSSRNIPQRALDSIASNFLLRHASDVKRFHLADSLLYRDQVFDYLRSKLKINLSDRIHFVTMNNYKDAVSQNNSGDSKNKIGVLYAFGDIVDGEGDLTNIGADRFVREFEKLRKDDDVKAIVFRVNSPGGSALASDLIWREVSITKKDKPVIVSMGDYAASGGYYISCNATKIVAEPTTLTGSIGVFGIIPNIQKLLNDKLGITSDGVGTGKYSDFGDIDRPLSDSEKYILHNQIDSTYRTFLKRVSDGRNKDTAYIDSIAQGRVWTGSQAIKNGLVDTLGDFNLAIRLAAGAAKISDYTIKDYPEETLNLWQTVVATLFQSKSDQFLQEYPMLKSFINPYLLLQNTKDIQARLPETFSIK
jgi:protease IV